MQQILPRSLPLHWRCRNASMVGATTRAMRFCAGRMQDGLLPGRARAGKLRGMWRKWYDQRRGGVLARALADRRQAHTSGSALVTRRQECPPPLAHSGRCLWLLQALRTLQTASSARGPLLMNHDRAVAQPCSRAATKTRGTRQACPQKNRATTDRPAMHAHTLRVQSFFCATMAPSSGSTSRSTS